MMISQDFIVNSWPLSVSYTPLTMRWRRWPMAERAPVLLNTTSPGNQINPCVTELSDGRILVTFVSSFDGTSNDGGIRPRVVKPDGNLQEEDFQVNTTTVGYQASVDVTALSGGRAVAVWFASGPIVPDDTGGNSNVGPGETQAQVIGAGGQPEGSDFVVNATDRTSAASR